MQSKPETERPLRRLRKSIVRPLRTALEPLPVWLAWWTIPRLSRKTVDKLAHIVGPAYLLLARRDRKIMRANLDLVYGPPATGEALEKRRALECAIARNAARVLLDFFWFARDTNQRLREHVEFDAGAAALDSTPGAFLGVTGHLGTWELTAQAFSLGGRRATCVYSPIGSPTTQKLLMRLREQNNQTLVPREGATRPILRALKRGDFVGLLLDQRTAVREGGVYIDFLGRKTTISQVAGVLSSRYEIPVHVAFCLYKGGGRYVFKVFGSLPADHGLSADEVNQWIADAISDAVRQHPEQWLWMYRRWSVAAPGEDLAKYPFYTRAHDPLHD